MAVRDHVPSYSPKLFVSRLGPKEVTEQIKKAQEFSPNLHSRFRNYSKWLKRVIADIHAGNRYAFGAYAEDEGSRKLVGTLILKKGPSGVAEAKNLLVQSQEKSGSSVPYVQQQLIRRVELFARRRGFSQIDFELFSDTSNESHEKNSSAINVLLSEGYGLAAIRSSTYFHKDTFYALSKKIVPVYSGDSLLHLELGEWILREHFGFTEIRKLREVTTNDKSARGCLANLYSFQISTSHAEYKICGCCAIDEGIGKNRRYGFEILHEGKYVPPEHRADVLNSHVKVLITFREISIPPEGHNVWVIDGPAIDKILGSDHKNQPTGKDIAGIILEISQQQFRDKIAPEKGFGYYLVNGSGLGLYDSFHSADGGLAFYAVLAELGQDHYGNTCPMVWGVSRILNIEDRSADSAFFSLPDDLRLWDMADYVFYVGDTDVAAGQSRPIYVLKLGAPVQFGSGVSLDTIPEGDLDHITKYISQRQLDELKAEAPEQFSRCDRQTAGLPVEYSDEGRIVSLIATVLNAVEESGEHLLPQSLSQTVNSKRALTALREEHVTRLSSGGGKSNQTMLDLQLGEGESLDEYLRRAEIALRNVRYSGSAENLWTLRLIIREILVKWSLGTESSRALRSRFPSAAELRQLANDSVARHLSRFIEGREIEGAGESGLDQILPVNMKLPSGSSYGEIGSDIVRKANDEHRVDELVEKLLSFVGEKEKAELIEARGALLAITNLEKKNIKDMKNYPETDNGKIDWLRIIAESVKGLPGGTVLLGGLLKHYDSLAAKNQSENFKNSIVQIVESREKIVLERLEEQFGRLNSLTDEVGAGLRLLTPVLDAQVQEIRKKDAILTVDELRKRLDISSWPFPGIPKALLHDELLAVFASDSDVDFFVSALKMNSWGEISSSSNAKRFSEFIDGIAGRDRQVVCEIFNRFSDKMRSSKVLRAIAVTCNAWEKDLPEFD